MKNQGFIAFLLAFVPGIGFSNPQGGQVSQGSATITQQPGYTHIQQSSDRAIINWQSFNIKANEHTHFQQPSSSSATLNRINAANGASQIFGRLSANGNLFLVNNAGIVFGRTARVDVGGLVATTANITDANFMAGRYHFQQSSKYPDSSVVNYGNITIRNGGMAALVAPGVENHGVIQANLGKVALGSGTKFTLDFYGDNLIHFATGGEIKIAARDANGNRMKHGVLQNGKIIADGGRVQISARAAEGVVKNVINMKGYIQANSVRKVGGTVYLGGGRGTIRVSGKIKARGKYAKQRGGRVKIASRKIRITKKAQIDVSGKAGGGQVYIGGNKQGKGPLPNADELYVGPETLILANAIDYGDGGEVILWSNTSTEFYGNIEAKGGAQGGDGGFVEVSSKNNLGVGGSVDLRAANGSAGTLLLDPGTVNVTNNASTAFIDFNTFTDGYINDQLTMGNLTITTSNADAGPEDVNFLMNSTINWNNSNEFKVLAGNDITFAQTATITNTGGGVLHLRADSDADGNGTIVPFSTSTTHVTFTNSGAINFFYNPTAYATPTDFSGNVNNPMLLNPYMLVNTPTDLENISQNPSGDYALGQDIDLNGFSFTSIPFFTGRLEGQNHNISNLVLDDGFGVGLIISVFGAEISNLHLVDVDVTGGSAAGALAAFMGNSTLRNISVSGQVNGDAQFAPHIGGVVGLLEDSGGQTLFDNVSNSATVSTLGSSAGGLIGGLRGSIIITNSHNSGDIRADENNAGGLIGSTDLTTNSELVDINNSYNTGNISGGIDLTTFDLSNAGGLIGYVFNAVNMTISDSHNSGDVSGDVNNAGGLIGYIDEIQTNVTINNSYNKGNVFIFNDNAGGLVGNANNVMVTNSYNNGSVTASFLDLDNVFNGDIAGGLLGSATNASIINSYNSGYVFSQNDVGGLVGDAVTTTIANSYNTGSVVGNGALSLSGNGFRVGGLVGSMNASSITNSYNVGSVNGRRRVGGLAGSADDISLISHSYNSGLVSQVNSGAIVGVLDPDSAVVNSYWDTETSNLMNACAAGVGVSPTCNGGATPVDSSNRLLQSTYSNLAIASDLSQVWTIFEGQTRPLLSSEYSTNITSPHQLQLAAKVPTANYNLMHDLDMSAIHSPADIWAKTADNSGGFIPIGTLATPFSGEFNGNNNVIFNLMINRPNSAFIGLIGSIDNASIHDVGLVNANVIGGNLNVGALIGDVRNSSAIYNTFSVNGFVQGGTNVGGLIGSVFGGSTPNSVANSYTTGTVIGSNINAGGLLGGANNTNITNSYSTSEVTGNMRVGGLMGEYSTSPTTLLSNSYSTGLVTGNSALGAFIGLLFTDVGDQLPVNSFYDSDISALPACSNNACSGVSGLPTAALIQFSTYNGAGWDIDANDLSKIWTIFDGQTRPMLGMEYSTTIRTPHQLQLAGKNLNANYQLAYDIDLSGTQNQSEVWGTSSGGQGGFIPIGQGIPFTGHFDGNSNVIKNLYISSPPGQNIGLFGLTNNANIHDVGLLNPIIDAPLSNEVGSLIGEALNTQVNNTFAYGAHVNSGVNIGGLIGAITTNSAISNSYSTGAVIGDDTVGGLVGAVLISSSVTNTYSTASVDTAGAGNFRGGLVGIVFSSSINSNYSTGEILNPSVGTDVGGFVGLSGVTLQNNYWDSNTANVPATNACGNTTSCSGVTDVSGAPLARASYTGLNIDDIISPAPWVSFDGGTRPILTMEFNTKLRTPHQLQLIGKRPGDVYTLANNIDLSPATIESEIWASDPSGPGFLPIEGWRGSDFSGVLEGKHKQIQNLFIERTGPIGLFNRTSSAYITNVDLVNAQVTTLAGSDTAGALIAQANDSTIINASSTGIVDGNMGSLIGGLIGRSNNSNIIDSRSESFINGISFLGGLIGEANNSIITNSHYFSGSVFGSGTDIGGLIGNFNGGSVIGSSSSGTVNGLTRVGGLIGSSNLPSLVQDSESRSNVTGGSWVGGLMGLNVQGTVLNSHSFGAVTGVSEVGGLIGNAVGTTITDSSSNSSTTGQLVQGDTENIGGLVGLATSGVMIIGSTNRSEVFSDDANVMNIGGLVGSLIDSQIHDSFNNFDVSATEPGAMNIGGFAGSAVNSQIVNSVNNGDVTGVTNVGGLVGSASGGSIAGSSNNFTGSIVGASAVGGLVGEIINASISNSFSNGTVTAAPNSPGNIGGLVGFANSSEITGSYSTGAVTVNNNTTVTTENVGGFVGEAINTVIRESYSSNLVTANMSRKVGGFIGRLSQGILTLENAVERSYSTSNVMAGTSDEAGGFIGRSRGVFNGLSMLVNNYSQGDVVGNNDVGGFIGFIEGNTVITNAYSTGNVMGNDDVGGFAGDVRQIIGFLFVEINNSFWDTQTSMQNSGIGGLDPMDVTITNLTGGCLGGAPCAFGNGTAQVDLGLQSTYTNVGWDFINIWGIDQNVSPYPTFNPPLPPPPGPQVNPVISVPDFQLPVVNPEDLFPQEPKKKDPDAKACVKQTAGSTSVAAEECANIIIEE